MSALTSVKLNRSFADDYGINPGAIKEGQFKVAFLNCKSEQLDSSPKSHSWLSRVDAIVEAILFDEPIALGFCEMTLWQVQGLAEKLRKTSYGINGVRSDGIISFPFDDSHEKTEEFGGNCKNEFVGLIFNKKVVEIVGRKEHLLDAAKKDSHRILVRFDLSFKSTHKKLTALVSHFDHKSKEDRKTAAIKEIEIIKSLYEEKRAWVSIGDRNCFPDEEGDCLYSKYVDCEEVCDFRDDDQTKPLPHYGPSGTFPGYEEDEYKADVLVPPSDGNPPNTLDVCFRSRSKLNGICYYAYFGGVGKEGEFLNNAFHTEIDFKERCLISDHYYVGGILSFKE